MILAPPEVIEAIKAAFSALNEANYTSALDSLEQPPAWKTWVIGLAFVTMNSFTAPLVVMILPCLKRSIYERIMAFLVSLGIGTISGSCFFIMIPQAFTISTLPNGDAVLNRSWLIVGSLYGFFFVDRALQYFMEWRRRRTRRRIASSAIEASVGKPEHKDGVTNSQQTLPTSECNGGLGAQPEELELDRALVNNVIARTFSNRRTVAVVRKLDGIEIEDGCSNVASAPTTPRGTVRQVQDRTLRRVNSGLGHITDIPPSLSSPVEQTNPAIVIEQDDVIVRPWNGPTDEQVEVSVQVVEKKVVNNDDMEIANICYIIIIGSTINNFLDAMSLGAGFADRLMRGISIGIATFCQQLPQEVGTLAILVNSGLGLKRTLLVNLLPNFVSYVGFAVGVVLDNVDESYDTYVFSISAGMYLYVFLGILIPEIREATEELIKTRLSESILVTAMQFVGIGGGLVFMYFMNKVGDIEI